MNGVAIGVFTWAALALTLAGGIVPDAPRTAATQAEGAVVASTDAECYQPSELVSVTLANGSSETIAINQSTPLRIYDSSGELVWEPFCNGIAPGESYHMYDVWDLKDMGTGETDGCDYVDAQPVSPGCYTAVVIHSGGGAAADFAVVDCPCPQPDDGPPPIPDGGDGTQPMRAERLEADGSRLLVTWDDGCLPPSTNLIYGPLDGVSSYTTTDALCGISSAEVWDPVPPGDLWFLLVSDDGAGVESSWGEGAFGERNGLIESGYCATTAKDVTGVCP